MSDLKEYSGLTGYEIAVIGMAGRFPGAVSVDEFWENLKNGKESLYFFSGQELAEAGVGPELLENSHYVKTKGMPGDVDCFDASFFEYTLREAEMMDPQMRILHQCAWEALEDAGYNPDVYGGFIGFYAGSGIHYHWLARILDRAKNPSEQFGLVSLNDNASMTSQVAYRLNLKGPAISLQTACSTSLVAVHMGCQALLSGECDMALAGGVSVRLPVKTGYLHQEGMVLSPDGHCRAFDAKAAGCVNGNGVGVVVLKTLEKAWEDRDHIYAVVKGTAVNNDANRRVGFLAPSVKGQAEVIRMAQQAADVHPETVTYVETHGTGTALGDPVEIRALIRAFDTEKKQFCRIGSVKTNMGHLDAAAGVTGFIKTVLSLHHKMIPPSLHFESPNPEIDFENSPFTVNTELREWTRENRDFPLRAGVSSFGIGGTNAHVVIEEAPMDSGSVDQYASKAREYQLVVLSARTEGALERNTHSLVEYLKKNPRINLADAAFTLQVGRKPFEYRRAVVCRNREEAVDLLSPGNSKKVHTQRVVKKNPPVVFLFSGLGSQYVNMGYGLYNDEPVFRRETDRCFGILDTLLDFSIKEILYPASPQSEANPEAMNRPEISQLVIFIFEYALAKLLIRWGITPHGMMGYSFGEYTAACIAGVFAPEEALRLIIRRGELIKKTPNGGMLSVPLPGEELIPLLREHERLSLAIDNGSSCIVAGPAEAIDAFENRLKQKKYLCMRLNTSHAIHSPLMDSILPEFREETGKVTLKDPQIPYISNLTGKWISAAQLADPGYWTRHLASTVRFSDGIAELVKEPYTIFLELGPGRDLSAMIRRYLGEHQRVFNLVRPREKKVADTAYLWDRVGRLWIYGKEIDWNGFCEGGGKERRRVSLPTYSFERQRFVDDEEKGVPVHSPPAAKTSGISPVYKRTILPEDYEAPRDEVEEKIAGAFQGIFGLDRIGIHDDFFELGGDSLKVITLVTNLHQQFNVEIPMDVVFKNPTVKELANYTGKKAAKSIFSAIPPVEEREYYPLSPSQLRVFIMEQIEEKGMAYNQPTVTWMDGPLDTLLLENVYKQLIQRHESLRTGFFIKDGEPVQKVYPVHEVEFKVGHVDISGGSVGQEAQGAVIEEIIGDFIRAFDLSDPPLWQVGLIKVSADKHLLMDMLHHIISDDISTGVLMTELSALYRGESLEPVPTRYKDYVVWREEVAHADSTLKEQEAFWLGRFSDSRGAGLPVLAMPFDYPRPELQRFEGAHLNTIVDAELREKLLHLAGKNKTTLFVLLFSLYNTLLYSYTGQEDIIVGIPITGRSHRDVQDVVGMFVNTLALRNFPRGNKRFVAFLQEVKEETLNAFSNQFYQFEDLVEKLDLPRDLSRNPIFDTMFILHTVDMEKIKLPGVKLRYYEFEHPACRFDLTLNAADTSGGLNLGVEYAAALFKKETMQRFLDDFLSTLETVVENPRVTLDEIKVRSYPGRKQEEEKKRILYEFNDTAGDYPREKTLQELLEEQAEKTPDNIALIGTKNRLTYRLLNKKSNRLARQLRTLGAASGTVVALMTDRCVEMLIGLTAVLKSGAAYLPIGEEYPVERVRYMVQHTKASIFLTTDTGLPHEYEHNVQFVGLNREPEMEDSPGERTDFSSCSRPTDLAYIIYTSGTTGVPKGVMIENRSVVNFIKGITDIIPFTPDDSILSLTTLAFDIFGLETLLPLTKGAAVVIGNMEQQLDAAAAAAVIEREKITIFQVTPSRLRLFISLPEAAASLRRLTFLLVGGEAFPQDLLEKSRALTQGKIYNLYGPTETTIWSSIKDVTEALPDIGKPLANTRIYIVDESGDLRSIGVPGELCISGHGVARGYFNDDSLTREKFIENPFIGEDDPDRDGNRRMYRTGDLARWLPDGNIEFLGRVDHQVKVRGFRIEPGEIEHLLAAHEAVKEAVVLPMEEENGERFLCAYIVSDTELEIPQLREYLSGDLPDYMIPSYFIRVREVPLTPNGKIDRQALRNTEGSLLESRSTYVAPKSDLERKIAGVWKKMLNLEKVGRSDNFFDLGGNSHKVIRLVSDLKKSLNRDIPVIAIFRYPTVGSLANFLNRQSTFKRKGKDRSQIKAKARERRDQKRRWKEAAVGTRNRRNF